MIRRGCAAVTGSIGTLLVLGASGDLAGRLLLPAVGQLLSSSQGPAALTLVGAGAEVCDETTWRSRVAAAFATVQATGPRVDEIVAKSTYLTADVTRPEDLQRLLDACEGAPAIYFALPPAVTARRRAPRSRRCHCRRVRLWCWRNHSVSTRPARPI